MCVGTFLFTSHYVSINSERKIKKLYDLFNLHPTMYLLIRIAAATAAASLSSFTSHYVSINSSSGSTGGTSSGIFTSHYVSINSQQHMQIEHICISFTSHYVSINS